MPLDNRLTRFWPSAYLSLRHSPRTRITATPGTRIERHPTARLVLADRLRMGRLESRFGDAGVVAHSHRTWLRLLEGSELRTSGSIKLGPGVRVVLQPNARLEIGSGTYISCDTNIFVRQSVTIGRRCAISWQVQIMDDDLHVITVDGEDRPEVAPVSIGDHVWIASRATIMKGVRIGDGA